MFARCLQIEPVSSVNHVTIPKRLVAIDAHVYANILFNLILLMKESVLPTQLVLEFLNIKARRYIMYS